MDRKTKDYYSDLHRKILRGGEFTDKELEEGYVFFRQLEHSLSCLGPTHVLSRLEVSRIVSLFNAMRESRRNARQSVVKPIVPQATLVDGVVTLTVDGISISSDPNPKGVRFKLLSPEMQKLAEAELKFTQAEVTEDSVVRSSLLFTMPYAIAVGIVIREPNFLVVPHKHTSTNGMYLPSTLCRDFNPDLEDTVMLFCVVNVKRRKCIDTEDGSRAVYRTIGDAVKDARALIELGNDSSVCP